MERKTRVIAIIPARFASSRFPGKILHKIAGQTLLQRTYNRVSLCDVDNIYIATDHEEIHSHAINIKADSIMTSIDCKNGTERITEAISKIPDLKDDDIIINMQGDHPLILPQTVDSVVTSLKNSSTAMMSTAATLFTNPQDALSPHSVKVVFDKDNTALYFSRSLIPHTKDIANTKFYYHVGIYAYRVGFLKQLQKLQTTPCQEAEDLEQLKVLEHGYKIKVALVNERPLGVDTPEDAVKVEKLLCQ